MKYFFVFDEICLNIYFERVWTQLIRNSLMSQNERSTLYGENSDALSETAF